MTVLPADRYIPTASAVLLPSVGEARGALISSSAYALRTVEAPPPFGSSLMNEVSSVSMLDLLLCNHLYSVGHASDRLKLLLLLPDARPGRNGP